MRWTVLLAIVAVLASSGCATGKDAVATGGDFTFVAPGGQTRISYDPPSSRRGPGTLAGENLTEQGRQISLADYPDKVVVLNLWGAWCPPCRAEAAQLQKVYDQTRDSGVQVVGIDLRDDVRSAPADFVRDRGLTYPSIYDPAGRTLLALRGYPRSAVPSTVVLDRRHRVAQVFLESLLEEDLVPVVRRLAAES